MTRTPRGSGSASRDAGTGACRGALLRRMEDAEGAHRPEQVHDLHRSDFNYGGRAEIIDAVRSLIADNVPADKVDERHFRAHLYYPDMPDPDVIVRTSSEFRISNFLLWELAYSELVFTDVLWPDFRRGDLFEAVREYQRRERRYGGIDRSIPREPTGGLTSGA